MAEHFSYPLYSGGIPLGPTSLLGCGGDRAQQFYFVDASGTWGSDGNPGTADQPLATIWAAYNKCQDGYGDTVVLMNTGASGGSQRITTWGSTLSTTSGIVWAKKNTHMMGTCAPTWMNQRSRITGLQAGNTLIPTLMTVSGSGCHFSNFELYQDYNSTSSIGLKVTGSENSFLNVNVQGMVNATAGADTGSCSLNIAGGIANKFKDCVVGDWTIVKAAANAELLFTLNAADNLFEGCWFPTWAGSTAHVYINAAAGALLRINAFKNCNFLNIVNTSASTMAVGATVAAACNGGLFFDTDCTFMSTAVSDSHANVWGGGSSVSTSAGIAAKLPA